MMPHARIITGACFSARFIMQRTGIVPAVYAVGIIAMAIRATIEISYVGDDWTEEYRLVELDQTLAIQEHGPSAVCLGARIGLDCGLLPKYAKAVIVCRIKIDNQRQLFQVAGTNNGASLFTRLGQGRQKHRGEDGNDGDYYQQFNQSKTTPFHKTS